MTYSQKIYTDTRLVKSEKNAASSLRDNILVNIKRPFTRFLSDFVDFYLNMQVQLLRNKIYNIDLQDVWEGVERLFWDFAFFGSQILLIEMFLCNQRCWFDPLRFSYYRQTLIQQLFLIEWAKDLKTS